MTVDEPQFLRVVSSCLPGDLSQKLKTLSKSSPEAETILDDVIRFVSGAESGAGGSDGGWHEKQAAVKKGLDELLHPADLKRRRDAEGDIPQTSKRPKLDHDDASDGSHRFTLHSVSTTSPIRKKVDIVVHDSIIKFVVPASQAVEAVVPVSQLSRAFILPTRGKTKPHWTVVVISTNTTAKGASSPQIIFGLDASAPSPLSTIDSSAVKKIVNKGDPTLPAIKELLSHLQVPILQPSTEVFKSACTSKGSDGCPGIEAYLGAKVGSLWFMKEGILWGESKPCEFWPVEDLMGKPDGLRMISATGRTCTLILTRRSEGDPGEEEEDGGEETSFSLIDGKEQDGINQWVKRFQGAFGKKKGEEKRPAPLPATGKMTIMQIGDESDEEDEDFKDDSDEQEEEATSDSSDEENGGGGDSGSEGDAEGSDDEDASGDEDEEVLKEENHPLLRPGAMPRMSRAAIEMVVDMVEGDMLSSDEDEEDELDD
ncbi:histone chaperone Rttp106-like-domain-containing protein [Desarmillaria tabescens]|uniref:Histone chaperone Rttp106-like-domain-containing protein n=1 Tax=Armillaria tabescens TaxID=1929756 RepID=A0AA39JVP9_ARMTA|nr:histone chaperone Rttp106-like-domain-containing protein [Desarmillaria tabescens]KAK0448329.1 histone chaperone Rttp106-like-domain-containing protein [Desarmillaria tabescens]